MEKKIVTTISCKSPMNRWPEIKDAARKMHPGAYGFGEKRQLTMCESSRPASLQSSVFFLLCMQSIRTIEKCTFDTEAWGLELAVRQKMATVGH